jgi:hypothetical protein
MMQVSLQAADCLLVPQERCAPVSMLALAMATAAGRMAVMAELLEWTSMYFAQMAVMAAEMMLAEGTRQA